MLRTDFSRGEQVVALFWLSAGALISLLLEAVYLGLRLPIGGGASIAFPVTIIVAFFFNMVLTRTARLWSKNPLVFSIPLAVWCVGYFGLLIAGDLASLQALGSNVWTILLMFAGVAGGVWPFMSRK